MVSSPLERLAAEVRIFIGFKNVIISRLDYLHDLKAILEVAAKKTAEKSRNLLLRWRERSSFSGTKRIALYKVTCWSSRRNIVLSVRHALCSQFLLSFD